MSIKAKYINFDNSQNYSKYFKLSKPFNLNYYIIGNTGNFKYEYAISSVRNNEESKLSEVLIVQNAQLVLNASNFVRIFWEENEEAESYNVYKNIDGDYKLLGNTSHWFYDDVGLTTNQFYLGENTGYNANNVNLGPLISNYTGKNKKDNFAGPNIIEYFYFGFGGIGNRSFLRYVYTYTKNIDLLLFSNLDQGNYNISLIQYNKRKKQFYSNGSVFITRPTTATNFTYNNVRMMIDLHSDFYVNASKDTNIISGVNTNWLAENLSIGCRIGLGSNNPELVTDWYEITSFNSNTSVTVRETIPKDYYNVPYVIEEIRLLYGLSQNAAPFNQGGYFLAKGLNLDAFRFSLVIPYATTIDKIRAIYKLNEIIPETFLSSMGSIYLKDKESSTKQILYAMHSSAYTSYLISMNVRAPLTSIIAGETTNTFLWKTYPYNNADNFGNLWYAKANHGPGKNIPSLYFSAGSRLYRISENKLSPYMNILLEDYQETRPMGGWWFHISNNMNSCFYYEKFDEFVNWDGSILHRNKYTGNPTQYGIKFGVTDRRYSNVISRFEVNDMVKFQNLEGQVFFPKNNIWYSAESGSRFTLKIFNFDADWMYANQTKSRLISPAFKTSSIEKFKKCIVEDFEMIGDDELGAIAEPYRVYYRTYGIYDDSGSWNLLDYSLDISFIKPQEFIQFMLEFKTMGTTCIPSRISSIGFTYEESDYLPSQFEWNIDDSNNSLAIYGFEQKSLSPINKLTISLYNLDTDLKVFETTNEENNKGTFEYWNGTAWISGIGPNIIGTRRRFTISQYIDVTNVYAKIQVN